MKISQIIDKINEYHLFVPAFQREYVWKKKDAKNLVDSLINDYPTGTMLTWETTTPPELKGDYIYEISKGAVKLILDGQQRITTLYMLMTGEIPPYYTEKEILNDIRGLYVNVETCILEYYRKTTMENDPTWVDITQIFKGNIRTRDIIDALEEKNNGDRLPREQENQIDDNIESIKRIREREFLEQVIPAKATIKEAIDIFYIVNSSGVNLTDAELALAQISGYWPEAREVFKKKLVELEKGGIILKLDHIIYILLAIAHKMGSKLDKLHDGHNKENIQEIWRRLESDVLDYVFNLMKSQAYIDHTKEVNTNFAFIPIIVYAYNKGNEKLNQEEVKKIVKWFYYSQIRQRYISQLQSKLDKDIGIIWNESNPFDKLLNIIAAERPLEIHKDEFVGAGTGTALYGLMRFYFKSKGAVCLSTGINIRKNMGKKYELESDHIFPYSILKKNGYSRNNSRKYSLAQEITNRAILTQTANRKKTNHLAEDYLANVTEQFPNSLRLQCIPEDKELWKLENYELFLDARRNLLAKELNEFLSNITVTSDENVDTDLIGLIKEGENSGVEFKTTMRYDMRENKVNKKLEEVILKTIAAFSNAEGGTLVMGVDDDQNIIGLENDYRTLKNGTKDEFELHLRNLVNNAYGVEFATNSLTVLFPEVEDTEICTVEIKQGLKPLYSEVSDKNGNKSKKFYVRSGNSSQEIDITEVASYVNQRFE